jgi:DNA-directed RNA polymerase subunit omega
MVAPPSGRRINASASCGSVFVWPVRFPIMRDDYVREALLVIEDPNVLINVVSRRVKQLKRGNRALVESLEKHSAEDMALREIIERKISFELASDADITRNRH